MHRPRPWGVGVAAAIVWALLAPDGASAVTLDKEGQGPFNCPDVRLTQAIQDGGGSRAYIFEGPCNFPGDGPNVHVRIRAEFKWLGTFGHAAEIADVTGDMTGKINATAKNCSRDPFVDGGGVCTGEKFISTSLPAVWTTNAPLMASRVPTGQVYTTKTPSPTPPPPSRGVRSSSSRRPRTRASSCPTRWGSPSSSPAVPQYPPKGGVRLQWAREVNGLCTYKPEDSLGVPHHTMTQMLGKNTFPEVGRYCLRAMSTPETPDKWTAPRKIYVFTPELQKSGSSTTGIGSSSAGGGKEQKVIPGPPKVNPATPGGGSVATPKASGSLTTPKAGSLTGPKTTSP